eukprot:5613835-Alexandrium_andersonii.AAC.1
MPLAHKARVLEFHMCVASASSVLSQLSLCSFEACFNLLVILGARSAPVLSGFLDSSNIGFFLDAAQGIPAQTPSC